MPRILFVSNTANFSKFNRAFMQYYRSLGWTVDYASAGEEEVADCDHQYKLSLARSPFDLGNVKATRELKTILNENQYDIIHCHTPMGGVVARKAAKKLRRLGKTKVIYTAHGFHFYKGAPLLNWLCYYPVEKHLSRYTDVLITINQEDFALAQKKFRKTCPQQYVIPGVGVKLDTFYPAENTEIRNVIRREKGFSENDFILLYTAEFIPRKNHKLLFDVLPELKNQIPNLKVVLCGKGNMLSKYEKYAEKNSLDYVTFTGYTAEVAEYCRLSDILFMPSFQEGLSIGMIEAIATGLPVVCSNIRGHVDVIEDGVNGYLCDNKNPESFVQATLKLYKNPELRRTMGLANTQKAQLFSVEKAVSAMKKIYSELTN